MKKSKILIVDDDSKSQNILSKYIEHMGYQPLTVSTGFDAIKAVQSQKPDIVILDIMLPDMNGLDVLSILKTNPDTYEVPVIIVTALDDEYQRIKSKEIGADDFITKPVSFQEMRGRINSIMKLRDLHNELELAQKLISRLTHYQENILLKFEKYPYGVGDFWDVEPLLENVVKNSYGELGPSDMVVLWDNDKGWWDGKYYKLKGKKIESEPLFLPRIEDDDDIEEESIRVIKGEDWGKEEKREKAVIDSEDSVKISISGKPLDTIRPQIAKAIGNIENYISYRTQKLLVIAANFDKELTKIDGQIMRSLFVSISTLKTISSQMSEIDEAFRYTVEALSRAAEANDEDTFNHLQRISHFSRIISETIGMDSSFVKEISLLSQLHDVGKIQVEPLLLKKPARLTDEEFEKVKLHTVYGARIIGDHPKLKMAKQIAMSHHERWDGTGYPLGLKGEEIPLPARIVAIADVYDAIRSKRPYKAPRDHNTAMEIISRGDSRTGQGHFDPQIKSAFMKISKEIEDIYKSLESTTE